jgi:hypothetical protein
MNIEQVKVYLWFWIAFGGCNYVILLKMCTLPISNLASALFVPSIGPLLTAWNLNESTKDVLLPC